MRTRLWAVAGVAAAGVAIALATPGEAEPTLFRLPVHVDGPGYDQTLRGDIAMGQGRRIAWVDEEASGGLDMARFSLKEADGRVSATWRMPAGDASRTTMAWRGPHDELLVVARRWATSMGIGIETWMLALLARGAHDPVVLTARDWGPEGVAVRDGHLAVLACSWDWPEAPADGSLDFVGAWFSFTGAALKPLGPWLARPYLYSFERERLHDYDTTHAARPARWLRPAKAKPFTPVRGPLKAPAVTGTVTAVEVRPEGIAVDLTPPKGAIKRLWLPTSDKPGDPREDFDAVGEHGVAYPVGYTPADPVKAWKGRQATFSTHDAHAALWLK